MYLSKWEEKALQGEFGEALQLSMNVLVKVCRALKAEKLVEISHAHVSGVSYFNIGDEGIEFLEDLVKKGAKTSIYTTANPASIAFLDKFRDSYSSEIIVKQRKIIDILMSIGIDRKSFTCIPYKLRMPVLGEHLAWAESSAVIYANSILGAKTNREGGITALMAAIAGRTCFSGMHLDENRCPTETIVIDFPIRSIAEASATGLYIGNAVRGIPYIKMKMYIDEKLKNVALRSFLASLASTSSCPLVLIEGVSPEAQKYVDKHSSLEKISIDFKDVQTFFDSMCSPILYLGCPHIDIDELELILRNSIEVLKILKIEKLYVSVPMYEQEKILKYIGSLEGIEIVYLPGACPVVSDLKNLKAMSTVHGKARHYIPKTAGASACLVDIV
ncbi:MAG: aconitase X catalytic domain-containing protein [Ignisphaera sp.]